MHESARSGLRMRSRIRWRPTGRQWFALIAVAALLAANTPTYAYTSVQGYVGVTEVIGSSGGAPGNFDFRIHLTGDTVICNNQVWAYVNTTDVNYSSMVANILAAKVAGWPVTMAITQTSSGYCQLSLQISY